MSHQMIDSNRPADIVWPPPPLMGGPGVWGSSKIPVTPEIARSYFFMEFVEHGVRFGAMYGGVTGLFFFIVGAAIGLPIGTILGLVLGLIDGALISLFASCLVRKSVPVPAVCYAIRYLTPMITMIAGALLLIVLMPALGGFTEAVKNWFVRRGYLIAVIASEHAAWYMTKEFMETYE